MVQRRVASLVVVGTVLFVVTAIVADGDVETRANAAAEPSSSRQHGVADWEHRLAELVARSGRIHVSGIPELDHGNDAERTPSPHVPETDWARLRRGQFQLARAFRHAGASLTFERLARHETLNPGDRMLTAADRARLESLIDQHRQCLHEAQQLAGRARAAAIDRLIATGGAIRVDDQPNGSGTLEVQVIERNGKTYDVGAVRSGVRYALAEADMTELGSFRELWKTSECSSVPPSVRGSRPTATCRKLLSQSS